MLSGETATGRHPTLVVETMCKIIIEVEKTDYYYNREDELRRNRIHLFSQRRYLLQCLQAGERCKMPMH
jgi:pyruvate kinase